MIDTNALECRAKRVRELILHHIMFRWSGAHGRLAGAGAVRGHRNGCWRARYGQDVLHVCPVG